MKTEMREGNKGALLALLGSALLREAGLERLEAGRTVVIT